MRATLQHVLTTEAFERMLPLAARFAESVQDEARGRGITVIDMDRPEISGRRDIKCTIGLGDCFRDADAIADV